MVEAFKLSFSLKRNEIVKDRKECIEKITGPKCEDPSKYRWDPKTGNCIEK